MSPIEAIAHAGRIRDRERANWIDENIVAPLIEALTSILDDETKDRPAALGFLKDDPPEEVEPEPKRWRDQIAVPETIPEQIVAAAACAALAAMIGICIGICIQAGGAWL